MNLKDLRNIDAQEIPVADIPLVAYHAATTAKKLKGWMADCEDLLKELNKRADSTLLDGLEKAETEYGKFTRAVRTVMVLPNDEMGGKNAVLKHVVDQVNAGVPVDEAFDILSTSLKKSSFDNIENDAELPLGIGRTDISSVKFTPKKA